MRPKESYTRFIIVLIGFILAILMSFQIYIFREPTRIAADEDHDKSMSVSEGKATFNSFCTVCHGEQGEGLTGPALNDKQFLAETIDPRIFSLISSGIPGTQMPAWNQSHGGPFTDQQVSQLVAFIRNWEPTAPDRHAEALRGNPSKGLVIFTSTCVVCHGAGGRGTDRAPALNDALKLAKFDDAWYINTIAAGRLAKGMPTWGTVLSPSQIRDLVALLRAWQRGETVNLPVPPN
jgi:cbb3-type cytochrome c oxidase subunit III